MQSLKKQFFITGTDTGVGKTFVSVGLLAKAHSLGYSTAAIKPVAAGCELTAQGLRNDDALQLLEQCSRPLLYEQVNPMALPAPVAPHIAAAEVGIKLDVGRLAGYCRGVLLQSADLTIVEGAGGWRVPLNSQETLAHLPVLLELPIILVVGMRLGCINHALLTAEAIAQDGLKLAGWVANSIAGDMLAHHDNITTLVSLLQAPLLGQIPLLKQQSSAQARIHQCAAHLDLSCLGIN